jgi:hypothetical protein
VSYRRVEDTFKQATALYHQKIEESEAAKCRELAARDTKHSQETAECEHWSSLQKNKLQIYVYCIMSVHFSVRMKYQWSELGKRKMLFCSPVQGNILKL